MEITPMNIKLKAALNTAVMLAASAIFGIGLVYGITYFPKVTVTLVGVGFALWLYSLNLSDLKLKQLTKDIQERL